MNIQHPEGWLLYYFHFKAVGAVVGYWYVSWKNPGGRVTLNFDKATYSDDEKALYNLVAKYRNKTLMALPLILYLLADFVVSSAKTQSHYGSFEGYFTSVIMGFFVVLTTTMGVKYLSAWWNIRKALKEDPTGEHLMMSVKNDPTFSRLDNQKPIINLPKLLKKLFK